MYKEFKNLPGHFHLLMMFAFISTMTSFIFPLIGPMIMRCTGATAQGTSLMVGTISFLVGLSQPRFGMLFDNGKLRLPFFISFVCILVGVGSFVVEVHSFWLFIFSIILLEVGFGIFCTTSNLCSVGLLPNKQREDGASLFYLALNLGLSVAAVIAYFFLEEYRRSLFTVDLFTTLTALCCTFFIAYKKRDEICFRESQQTSDYGMVKRTLLKHWHLSLGLIILYSSMGILMRFIPVYLEYMGMDTVKLTALNLFINTIVVCIGVFLTKDITRFLGKKRVVLLVGVLFAGSFGLLPFFSNIGCFVVFSTLFSIGEVLLVRISMPVFYELYSKENKGLASGSGGLIRGCAAIVGPVSSLIVYSLPIEVAAIILGGLSVLGGFLVMCWLKHRQQLPYHHTEYSYMSGS